MMSEKNSKEKQKKREIKIAPNKYYIKWTLISKY